MTLKLSRLKAPETRFRWDRGIRWYRVVAVLDPNLTPGKFSALTPEDKNLYKENKKEDWVGNIFELKTPVLQEKEFSGIISTDKFNIYKPFYINKKSAIDHSFDDIFIPINHSHESVEIPDYAVRGVITDVNIKDCDVYYGIRIDTHKSVDANLVLELFLKLLRQHSYQWWLGSPRNPFDYGYRIGFDLENNFRPKHVQMDPESNEIESTWFGGAATQNLIGIEAPLNEKIWTRTKNAIVAGVESESALNFFFEAISSYMNYDNRNAIMYLALCFEVAENKIRILAGNKAESKNKKIIENPNILKEKKVPIFRKLITDRDNIAHGRQPYHIIRDPVLMVMYMDEIAEFISDYINLCKAYDWKKVSSIDL